MRRTPSALHVRQTYLLNYHIWDSVPVTSRKFAFNYVNFLVKQDATISNNIRQNYLFYARSEQYQKIAFRLRKATLTFRFGGIYHSRYARISLLRSKNITFRRKAKYISAPFLALTYIDEKPRKKFRGF